LRLTLPAVCAALLVLAGPGAVAPAGGAPATAGSRLLVTVMPTRLHAGYPATIDVSDKGARLGQRIRACLGGDAGRCSTKPLGAGELVSFRVTPRFAGTATVAVSDGSQEADQAVRVDGGRLRLLATGDSEMQVLDDYLASDLAGGGGARVIADARQSTAITSPFLFNWPLHAIAQVASDHPDIVAMFLGGNEGFPIDGTDCCGAAWSIRYAGLVERMMDVYRQNGAAVVYWFLIPTPSAPSFVRVVDAVNRGIVRAAAEFPDGVNVFDLRPTFSPGGRYIDSLDYDGREITVHEPDGFHLSASADVIVARRFVARLRADGVLP
jgi:hypothetical protein